MGLPGAVLLLSALSHLTLAANFTNPVIWQDHPDLDVFRLGSVFYYSSSTFAFSPGAPLLRSYDLATWEPVTHSVPVLPFGSSYNLPSPSNRAYVGGIWASTLRYRPATDTFYWLGCVKSTQTYVFTAPGNKPLQNGGEVSSWNWTNQPSIPSCYYDVGLLIDDDAAQTMYVAYGVREIRVAQLSETVGSNGQRTLREVRSSVVYRAPNNEGIEGSRMYKINGTYYIFITRPADAEWVLKSSSPFGPYTMRQLVTRINGPLASAGFSHQGGIVDTPDGRWYYVAFMDAYPGGRIPVVAPLVWGADGWPKLVTDASGAWAKSYELPVATTKTVVNSLSGRVLDEFKGGGRRLGEGWEWNHNPDDARWALATEGGLTLRTATVTDDLFGARNTLTHRIVGPKSSGTFRIDVRNMKDGDRAGAVLFRDRAGYIGVHKSGTTANIVVVHDLTLTEGTWVTASKGRVVATGPAVGGGEVFFRIEADITPSFNTNVERRTTFSYSLDGTTFTSLGPGFAMTNSWRFFTGYRYGVFNFATKELGGEVKVKSFEMRPTS